jgi:HD superfamily phosphohydrolase
MGEDFRYKIICDPVHGEIPISRLEQRLIDSPSFQRLRNLKQLGLASLVYPNATHTRFAHSLGVFCIMSRVIDLFRDKGHFNEADKRKMRIAALLHDIGHYPYSHLMEFIDRDDRYRPTLLAKESAGAGGAVKRERYPKHEKVGQLIITKRPDIVEILASEEIDPAEIASIISGEHSNAAYNRLIKSSLDMDRMDYLVRDSLGTGVPYGRIDLNYLLSNLDVVKEKDEDGQEIVDVVLSSKAATATEHFLIARYFMHKVVYFHKTTFGFEALLRHILFIMRDRGDIYEDGVAIESMIMDDAEFLNFHDGYIDGKLQELTKASGSGPLIELCRLLKNRTPPKLLHEVAVLKEASHDDNSSYALFRKDKVRKIKDIAAKHGLAEEFWIWEELPKDVSFESLGPFVPLSQMEDIKPGEAAELIRIRRPDGAVRKLVEDPHSIIHHLSKLRLQMSRLYLAKPVSESKLDEIRAEVRSWAKPD